MPNRRSEGGVIAVSKGPRYIPLGPSNKPRTPSLNCPEGPEGPEGLQGLVRRLELVVDGFRGGSRNRERTAGKTGIGAASARWVRAIVSGVLPGVEVVRCPE